MTMNLKHSEAGQGRLTPAHPQARPGWQDGGAYVIAVTGLDDRATVRDAIRILESIMLPSWLHEAHASQAGKNLYRDENLTPEQLAAKPEHLKKP